MKSIISIIAIAFALMFNSNNATAQSLSQDQARPEVVAKTQVSQMSEKLDLNGDQQRSIFRTLVTKEMNYKKLVNGNDLNDPTVKANKQKIDAEFDNAMKKTLTDAQYKKWLKMNE